MIEDPRPPACHIQPLQPGQAAKRWQRGAVHMPQREPVKAGACRHSGQHAAAGVEQWRQQFHVEHMRCKRYVHSRLPVPSFAMSCAVCMERKGLLAVWAGEQAPAPAGHAALAVWPRFTLPLHTTPSLKLLNVVHRPSHPSLSGRLTLQPAHTSRSSVSTRQGSSVPAINCAIYDSREHGKRSQWGWIAITTKRVALQT